MSERHHSETGGKSKNHPNTDLRAIEKHRPKTKGKTFRHGKDRDKWYGFNDPDFQDWWHRMGKDENGGRDIENRKEAQKHYDDWVSQGRPTPKEIVTLSRSDFRDKKVFESAISGLMSPDKKIALKSVDVLRLLKKQQAVPALIRALRAADPRLRNKAALALASLRAGEAVPQLVSYLENAGTDSYRGTFIHALASLADSMQLHLFVDQATRGNFEVQCESILAIHELPRPFEQAGLIDATRLVETVQDRLDEIKSELRSDG